MKNKIKGILLVILAILLFYLYKEYYQVWLKQIIEIQRKLIPLISQNFKREDKAWIGFIFLFFYGLIHSIGPGHGKLIISSITVIEKINFKKIIVLSGIISYLQGFSALLAYKVFILIGKKLIPNSSFYLEDYSRKISAVFLIILGIYFFYKEFKNKNFYIDKKSKKNPYLTSFLLGIIPCSGILNILIFLTLLKLEKYSILSVLSVCTGMFITLIFSGVFSDFISGRTLKNKVKLKYIRYTGFIIMILYGFNFIS